MIHIRPQLIRMFRSKMIQSFRFVGRYKLTSAKAALSSARRTSVLVLLQIGTIHQCTAMRTLHTNAVQKSWREVVLASDKGLFAAQRTWLELSDTRGAEHSSAFEALTRICAELCANRALEFVAHVELFEILFGLQTNKFVKTNFLNFIPSIEKQLIVNW